MTFQEGTCWAIYAVLVAVLLVALSQVARRPERPVRQVRVQVSVWRDALGAWQWTLLEPVFLDDWEVLRFEDLPEVHGRHTLVGTVFRLRRVK